MGGLFLAAEPRLEAEKARKMSLLVEQSKKEVPRMTPDDRERLNNLLITLAPVLPGHIVELLHKHCIGDCNSDEIEIDVHSMEDSALFELKTQLDKFDEEIKTKRAEDEDVDICGDASPAIFPHTGKASGSPSPISSLAVLSKLMKRSNEKLIYYQTGSLCGLEVLDVLRDIYSWKQITSVICNCVLELDMSGYLFQFH